MNTKTTKFLAVLAVLAFAFAVFAVVAPTEQDDATTEATEVSTFAELVEAIEHDDTSIILTANISTDKQLTIDCSTTIDFDGYTLASTYKTTSGVDYAIIVNATSGSVTLKNGTVTVTTGETATASMHTRVLKQVAGDLTVTDMKMSIDSAYGEVLCNYAADSTLTVKDSTIEAKGTYGWGAQLHANGITLVMDGTTINAGMCGLAKLGGNNGMTITIDECTITSAYTGDLTASDYYDGAGIYLSGTSAGLTSSPTTATISDSTISGPTGIEVKWVNLVLNDCTVSATKSTTKWISYSNGTSTEGFSVVAGTNGSEADLSAISIKINDGKYTGPIGLAEYATELTAPVTKDAAWEIKYGDFDTITPLLVDDDAMFALTGADSLSDYDSTITEVTVKGAIEIGADMDFTQATSFNIDSGAFIYAKSGTFNVRGDTTPAFSGQIAVVGGTVVLYNATPSAVSTPTTNVIYSSGAVQYAAATGTPVDRTSIYQNQEDPAPLDVTNVESLEIALEEGATNIKVTGAIEMAKATDDIAIPKGVTVTAGTITLAKNDKYSIGVEGGALTATISTGTKTVGLEDLVGTYKIAVGSVVIDASTIVSGTVTPTSENLVITGTLTGELTIEKGTGTVYFTDFTIAPTGVLTLQENTYYAAVEDFAGASAFYMYGSIKYDATNGTDGHTTIKVQGKSSTEKSTLTAYSGAKLSENVLIEGSGKYYSIDLSGAMKILEINTDITASKTFGQLEAVTVIKSLTISNGAEVTILGSFTVADGVTVTVEDGAKLTVKSTVSNVDLTGRLIVESDGTFTVEKASSVDISGSLVSEGTVVIGAPTVVKKGGVIDIRDDAVVTTISKGLTVNAGGDVTLRSKVTLTADTNAVTNKGSITLQNMVMQADCKISMAASDAIVEIKSVSGAHTLTVTDEKMSFGALDYTPLLDDPSLTPVKTVTYVNTISFTPTTNTIKGLIIAEAITSYDYEGLSYYQNRMILSGSVTSINAEDGTAIPQIIKTTGTKWTQVDVALALGKKVTLNVGGILTVNGILTAIADESVVTGTAGTTQIYALGAITTITPINDIVNGALFTTEEDGVTYYNYTPLLFALESGADTVNVYGTIDVDDNYTIGEDITLKINADAVLKIGSNNTETIITVEDGASIRGAGTIEVYGTLAYENKKDSKVITYSDVYVEDDTSCMYTNIYTALATADDGDTVTLSKSTTLKNSLTIKNGVKLYVPASLVLTLKDGVTLTVNGTLETVEPVKAQTAFAAKASVLNKTSAIVVNGVFDSLSPIEYDGESTAYMISGAYYTISGYNYVSPLETAADSKATNVCVYGDVSAGSVAFTGTSSSPKYLYVMPDSELKAVAVTLKNAFLAVGFPLVGEAQFSGNVVVGDAIITANKVNYLTVESTDNGTERLLVDYAYIDEDIDDAGLVATAGQIAVDTVSGLFIVGEDAEVIVPASTKTMDLDDTIVYGLITIGSGESAVINGNVLIMGGVTVASATDTAAAGNLDVNGVIYLGIDLDDMLGAAAVLSGPMSYYALYAIADAIVDDETVEDMLYTEFYVGLSVWMTVYVPATSSDYIIGNVEYVDDLGLFNEWQILDGTSAETEKIGSTGYEAVYADIAYDIYSVYIYTDAGVKSVSIDGIELYNSGNNKFQLPDGVKLLAGTHTVTYTMKAGYSGTPTLKTIDGTLLKDYKFITSGIETEDLKVSLQLNGTEPTPEPEPTPTPEEKSEWTVTTILLCVLVVLIAIMAVIVALRLNRN